MTLEIRPRTAWQNPAQPVVGPAMNLRTVTMLPAHYTAAASVPSDTAPYLRAIQNDYTVNRGYSIGYNFAIDRAGVAWQLRGFDIKCAANKGMNDVTIAVLCLVNGADAMNPAMVDTFRQLGAEAQRRVAASLLVVGHRDIGATACPGNGIYHQVVTGQLEPATDPTPPTPDPPQPTPPTPTPPAPPREDYEMAFIIQNTGTGEIALIYGDRQMVGLAGQDLAGYQTQFGPMVPTDPVVWASFLSKSK